MIRVASTAFLLSFGAAVACSPSAPVADEATVAALKGKDAPEPAISTVHLLPLGAGHADRLEGELRCAFTGGPRSEVLFVAAADVDKSDYASAVVNDRGEGVMLEAAKPGGFSALNDGGLFSGGVLTARIDVGEETSAPQTEFETFDATLTVWGADGSEVGREGVWSCGP